MQISKDMEYDLVKKYNSFYQKEEKNNTIIFNSKFDKKVDNNIENIIRENSKERNEKNESNNFNQYNEMISYFYSTAQYLKHSNEYNSIHLSMLNSKNYIPKIVFQKKQYKEEYENNNTKKEDFIYNKKDNNFNFYNFEQKVNEDNNKVFLNNKYINKNYLSNENVLSSINIEKRLINNNPLCLKKDEEKNILNGYYKLFDNNINYPVFFPSNYKKKEDNNSFTNSKHSEKIESASSLSKKEENNSNSNYPKNGENLQQKTKEDEYLTEMFGKKGWICILCNNFNYQTRNKCNRCGAMKKPKKILNTKERNKEIKERDNSKDNWICMNCKNFNYSFRNVCNRCKAFRINKIIYCPLYSFTPSFNIFNIMYNVNKQFN